MKLFYSPQSLSQLFMMTGLAMGLSGCGAKDNQQAPAPIPAPAPAPAPAPPPSQIPAPSPTQFNGDWVRQYLVPQFQSTYGNITIQGAATIRGVQINAGEQSWDAVYAVVLALRNQAGSQCNLPAGPNAPTVPASPWVGIDYGCFQQNFLPLNINAGDTNAIQLISVTFQNSPGYRANLYMVFDMLISANYSIYQNTFYNQYYYGAGYNINPWTPYAYNQGGYSYTNPWLGNSVSGGLIFNNNGFNLNIGGMFRF